MIDGDPLGITIHVAGVYNDSARTLSVQVLANPDDLASWVTIGSTQATTPEAEAFTFAVDVQPVVAEPDRVRWPRGGVLRLRVIDDGDFALPHDPETPTDTVIGIAGAGGIPVGWAFLSEKPVGSIAETQLYYTAIDAPLTLADFQTRFGFPGDETTALYYNSEDLGIGREMHCRATQTPVGGLACYVRNYGIFGGDRNEAFALALAAGPPLATVAMVYTPPIEAPNSVTFMVYGPNDALVNEAQLDSRGDNTSIPQNCLNCHGGRSSYDLVTHTATNARFLPFDPSAFEYVDQLDRPDLTLPAQEDKLRRFNRLVANAAPTTAVREMIDGMFPIENTPFDPNFIPAGWNESGRDARIYSEVVAPYCRSCHASFENGPMDSATFATAAGFRAKASSIISRVCAVTPRGMPTAEKTAKLFYASPARALLLTWLEAPGACAPATIAQ